MAMTAAVATVPAALKGFPIFPIPHHAPDYQSHDTGQNHQYNNCTHLYTPCSKFRICPPGSYAAFFLAVFISSVLLTL